MSLYIGGLDDNKKINNIIIGSNDGTKVAEKIYIGDENSKPQLIYVRDNIDDELSTIDPVDLLTSGRITKFDIGKTVYISNSYLADQEWVIADVNHDNTKGTVDLITKYTIDNTCCTYENEEYYESELRFRMYDIVEGFSTEVINNLVSLQVTSNKYVLNDLLKNPSMTEVGIQPPEGSSNGEGEIYPIFGNSLSDTTNANAIRLNSSQKLANYWTRTTYNGTTMLIDTTGTAIPSDENHLEEDNMLIIRFKKASDYESKDEMFTHVNNRKLFKKGVIDRSDIGRKVLLTNDYICFTSNPCIEWYIADLNHDGTEDTIDLISANICEGVTPVLNGSSYKNSLFRSNAIGDGVNKFDSNIRDLLVSCGAYSEGVDLGDKMKILSYEELGMPATGCTNCAGTKYPIFNYVDGAEINESTMGLDFMMDPEEYYVRNYYLEDVEGHPGVGTNGNPITMSVYESIHIFCIRIKCY